MKQLWVLNRSRSGRRFKAGLGGFLFAVDEYRRMQLAFGPKTQAAAFCRPFPDSAESAYADKLFLAGLGVATWVVHSDNVP